MNLTILICGADKDTRFKKAFELAEDLSTKEDILIFDAEMEKGIGAIRILVSKLAKKPFNSKVTTAIISEAQYLTIEAQNSMLKVIEEPNETTRLILTVPSEYSLLATISSRCQKLYLDEVEVKKINMVSTILKAKVSDRLDLFEKINLFDLAQELHWILNSTIKKGSIDKSALISLTRYIRFLERINSYKQIANPRLAKYLAIISFPKSLESLA